MLTEVVAKMLIVLVAIMLTVLVAKMLIEVVAIMLTVLVAKILTGEPRIQRNRFLSR